MRRTYWLIAAAVAALAVVAAGCGGSDNNGSSGSEDVTGTISATATWSGAEQDAFQKVIDGFNELYPNVTVNYTSGGDQLPTQLSTAVAGGNPPDVAAIPQPGLMKDLVDKGALKSLEFARDDIEKYFSETTKLGEVDGTLYGLLFKASNKSLVWYNVPVLSDAGVEPPTTWDDLLSATTTINDSGVPAWSIGGADGWTLTDLFENIYIRSAGADMYDQLAAHEIPWTDQSVKDALSEMAKIVASDNIAGGTTGALQTDFPTSVTQVYADPPKAAMVSEGDFVAGVITDSTSAQPGDDFDVFAFPSINDSPESVVGGGDFVVMFTDNDATQAFVQYLATPAAAEIWAEQGGYASLNKELDTSKYPDDITRTTAGALTTAEVFRFDLSDLQPSAFGGTVGQGLFKEFQDFLKNPSDIDGITQQMEDSATQAYASS
jgi:alpha-glucoside transport system substrate-binding protein